MIFKLRLIMGEAEAEVVGEAEEVGEVGVVARVFSKVSKPYLFGF